MPISIRENRRVDETDLRDGMDERMEIEIVGDPEFFVLEIYHVQFDIRKSHGQYCSALVPLIL